MLVITILATDWTQLQAGQAVAVRINGQDESLTLVEGVLVWRNERRTLLMTESAGNRITLMASNSTVQVM